MTRLELERRNRRLSQREVAAHVGLTSPSAVSRWERGNRRPLPLHAAKLEALFGMSTERLLNDSEADANADLPKDNTSLATGVLR